MSNDPSRRDTIVVLGGGEDQVGAYLAARRLGYRVVGVDLNPRCLGATLADQFLPVTTRDARTIARHLDGDRVALVISPASDAAQDAVSALNHEFGTGRVVPDDVLRAGRDKSYFHEVVRRAGFAGYLHAQGDSASQLEAFARSVGGPVVVKPSDSSGSKGLRVVTAPPELAAAIDHAQSTSATGTVIVEELLIGRHLTAECFLEDGSVGLMCLTDRELTAPPQMITLSHTVPASVEDDLRDRMRAAIQRICREMDYRDGPINVDLLVLPDGDLRFIEMGARLGGNGMPMLVESAFGIDTVTAAIQLGLGQQPALRASSERVAMLRILTAANDGRLRSVAGLEHVRADPQVQRLELCVRPGDEVQRYTEARHKLGYVTLTADDHHQLLAAADHVAACLSFEIDSEESEVSPCLIETDAAS